MEKHEARLSPSDLFSQPGSGYQVLVKDETVQIIANSIAVALTLTLPCPLIIVSSYFPEEPESSHHKENTCNGRVCTKASQVANLNLFRGKLQIGRPLTLDLYSRKD